jgi:hypothetical protein
MKQQGDITAGYFRVLFMVVFALCSTTAKAQTSPALYGVNVNKPVAAQLIRQNLLPVRIVWQSPEPASVSDAESLLRHNYGQAGIAVKNPCTLKNKGGILLDFGKEIHGGLQVITDQWASGKPIKVRIRFGESASEAMSNIDTIKGATNDHAIRDYLLPLPWMGKAETGNTGFRFVRIDLADSNAILKLIAVNAVFVYRNIPYLGSFHCSDTLLNKIWATGAYTVHLNMQDYLWDGIKRDRLVWIGDMHPETSTIAVVFGDNEVITQSLDLVKNNTPLPGYMNGIVAYSMWWVLIQYDYYMHNGNLPYLKAQKSYLVRLLRQYSGQIGANGSEQLKNGWRFLDWPSSTDPKAIHAGLQGLLALTLTRGAQLCRELNDPATASLCEAAVLKLKKHHPEVGASKQAAALLALSGLLSPEKADHDVISVDGAHRYSTFFGFYMLLAKAKAGHYQDALNVIREYWGAMLKMGATTFWEDFNIDWLPGSSGIDKLVPKGMKDIHGDFGAYCYKGFRHSLAHGWSSGPTPWLTTYVLGVKVLAPGCKVIKIEPHLCDLKYADGTFPTPYGIVKIKNTRLANGKISTKVDAPAAIKIIR